MQLRTRRALLVLLAALPLMGSKCSFSSDSGDTEFQVAVCTLPREQCPQPETGTGAPSALLAAQALHSGIAATPVSSESAVPEPGAALLFGAGLALFARYRRRRRIG